MNVAPYFESLLRRTGEGWNRFWFQPSDPLPLALVRIAAGTISFYIVASFGFDLLRYLGPNGILSTANVRALLAVTDNEYRFSYLNFAADATTLWALHAAGLVVLAAFTVGLFTRITSVLSVLVLLAYVHRTWVLTDQAEPILSMLLLYLSIGPAGDALSVDAWRKRRKAPTVRSGRVASYGANVAIRLLQVHTALIYLMMFLGKQLVTFVWWQGTAVWWLIARPDTCLVDLRWMHDYPYLVNLWTASIPLFELAFALLIWKPLLRPLLVVGSAFYWLGIALLLGNVPFCAAMFVAGLSFVDASQWRALCGRCADAAPQLAAARK